MTEKTQKCCVQDTATLLETMRAINEGAVGVALVQDASQRLLGVLTDGDIRRALLQGATLQATALPFVNRRFTSVGTEECRAHVLDLMQSFHESSAQGHHVDVSTTVAQPAPLPVGLAKGKLDN